MFADTSEAKYSTLLESSQPNDNAPTFCQFFAYARQAHGLSIKQLARLTGMRERQIAILEGGQIWGCVTKASLGRAEAIFGLRRGSLMASLRDSVLTKPTKRRMKPF